MALSPRPQPQKDAKEALTHQRTMGRGVLLVIAAFTVINLLLLLTRTNQFIVFSATLPYYATLFSMVFDNGAVGGYTIGALVVSAVMVSLYIACWLLSGDNSRWLTAGLILFSVDTAMLVILSFILNAFAANLLDIAVHAVGLWELWQAVRANKTLNDRPSANSLRNR